MASHDDRDSPIPSKLLRELADKDALQSPSEALANLQRRGEEMTLRRQNLVTAGVDGERVLMETRAKGLRKNAEAEAERLRALLTDAVSALEDLGACGDADCTEPNCLHILPRAREALRAAREREG